MKAQKYDVSEYQGYVKARVLANHYRLPDHIKTVIGVDDCIQEALLYLHKALNGLEGWTESYDSKKSKLTTWIYTLVDSYFSRLITTHMTRRRAAFLITIDELPKHLVAPENATVLARRAEAIDKVTKLHLDASSDLMDFIASNLYFPKNSSKFKVNITSNDFKSVTHEYTGKPRKVKCSASEVFTKRKQEFLFLAKRHGVTADHYRMALSVERR